MSLRRIDVADTVADAGLGTRLAPAEGTVIMNLPCTSQSTPLFDKEANCPPETRHPPFRARFPFQAFPQHSRKDSLSDGNEPPDFHQRC
jgi:hypothetical protein